MSSAESLKVRGNKCFQVGDFVGAEKFYTQAIAKDPTNAAYFTNRALARMRMSQWDSVLDDCHKALELLPSSLKAYTYLGAALMQLGRPGEAFTASRTAYGLAISQRSPSVSAIAASCLQAKKAQWEEAERERVLQESQLLRDVCNTVMNAATPATDAEKRDICRQLEVVFAHSDAMRLKMRRVPDWLIDNITFGIMWDPVVTIHGHSYDRATLIDHLKRSQTDPLTREPLTEADLRPNLALRAASEEFLKENGWAVDW